MKAIYFADPGGDIEEECETLKRILRDNDIHFDIEATDIPPFDKKFDILFFDWGGLSIGNSMLEHFCRWIIENAEDNPGRVYIMTSLFTEEAMKDAILTLSYIPKNIYLNLNDSETIKVLKIFSEKDDE